MNSGTLLLTSFFFLFFFVICNFATLGCDKTFSRPDSLTTHTKTHSNHRPYICPVEGCPKAYYHARSLKKHELSHDAKRTPHRALRGPGFSQVSNTPGSVPMDLSGNGNVGSSANSPLGSHSSQQPAHFHHSHPYHPDFTAGGGRASKHQGHHRQLSQTAGFNLAAISDPALSVGSSPINVLMPGSALSSGANSPSPGAMGSPNYSAGGYLPGATVLKPPLATHSSTSPVPSLSMVMSSTSMPMTPMEAQGMPPSLGSAPRDAPGHHRTLSSPSRFPTLVSPGMVGTEQPMPMLGPGTGSSPSTPAIDNAGHGGAMDIRNMGMSMAMPHMQMHMVQVPIGMMPMRMPNMQLMPQPVPGPQDVSTTIPPLTTMSPPLAHATQMAPTLSAPAPGNLFMMPDPNADPRLQQQHLHPGVPPMMPPPM